MSTATTAACAGNASALEVHGTRWVAMYLPVWLYSHYHESGGKGMVHYIAVNGRTGEVMGSVPVSHRRLLLAALSVGRSSRPS